VGVHLIAQGVELGIVGVRPDLSRSLLFFPDVETIFQRQIETRPGRNSHVQVATVSIATAQSIVRGFGAGLNALKVK
jgi:hypothetical protein